MGRPIRALPPAVADAIAAGEVVERPASVVKELAENAVDAGARRIGIEVEGGGVVRIRVVDDGGGIPEAELILAVARHATSKITGTGDLERVGSLGFRGEALASIAAVADVELTSRPTGAVAGARLRVRASMVIGSGAAAAAPGTTVEVRDLFFATPARLRFLRSGRAEQAACVRVAGELALSHPEVAITCAVDGRTVLRSPGGSLLDACRAVLGPAAAAELVEVVADGEPAIGGLVSQPRAHRGTRGGLVLVVNGRRVHNRALTVAVEEAYRGLLPVGRYPFGVVTVDLDPSTVDVNVHPAKREVRFQEEGRVFAAVQRGVWAVVQGGAPYAGSLEVAAGDRTGAPARAVLSVRDHAPMLWEALLGPAGERASTQVPGEGDAAAGATGGVDASAALRPQTDDRPAGEPGAARLGDLAPLRALGQASTAWMVAESPRGVVLVDPHAAHEKVLYAELLAALAAGPRGPGGASQLLLLPVLVECDRADATEIEERQPSLAALGFDLAPFGPATLRCAAVPAAAATADPARLVRDIVEGLRTERGPVSGRDHRLAALVACHGAVRFGDRLDLTEQQRLLDLLTVAPGGLTCPHGRPTVVVLDDATLRRAFGRPAV